MNLRFVRNSLGTVLLATSLLPAGLCQKTAPSTSAPATTTTTADQTAPTGTPMSKKDLKAQKKQQKGE